MAAAVSAKSVRSSAKSRIAPTAGEPPVSDARGPTCRLDPVDPGDPPEGREAREGDGAVAVVGMQGAARPGQTDAQAPQPHPAAPPACNRLGLGPEVGGGGRWDVVQRRAEGAGQAEQRAVQVKGRRRLVGGEHPMHARQAVQQAPQRRRHYEQDAAGIALPRDLGRVAGELDGVAQALLGVQQNSAACQWLAAPLRPRPPPCRSATPAGGARTPPTPARSVPAGGAPSRGSGERSRGRARSRRRARGRRSPPRSGRGPSAPARDWRGRWRGRAGARSPLAQAAAASSRRSSAASTTADVGVGIGVVRPEPNCVNECLGGGLGRPSPASATPRLAW